MISKGTRGSRKSWYKFLVPRSKRKSLERVTTHSSGLLLRFL